jgi:dolichyl-diphosphooligosaccharide--protein glycosyltransferase
MSTYIRMPTFNSKIILDYDPWWFYRHAKDILDNNFMVPKWDLLSFYPPGRPAQPQQGWPYIIVVMYKVISIFSSMSFMDVAKLSPVIMSALTVIPAFFLGKLISNKWGGIATSLFATLTPTFIGVSMAGYCDTDAPVVFFSFLCTWIVILAIQKKKILYYALAVLLNTFFIYTWFFGWYILFFFGLLIPALFVFRLVEDIAHEKKLRFDLRKALTETKDVAIPILIILIATNIAIIPVLGILGTVYSFITINLGFVSHTGMLVNVSVAELQVINILTKAGFQTVADRIGLAPTLLTLIALPLLVFLKVYKKIKIHFAEIFMFLWALLTFYMILNGIRFSIQFSIAASTAAGYVIGNMAKYLRKDVIGATLFGFVMVLILVFVSNAIQMGYQTGGMEVDQNWVSALDWLKQNADQNSLVVTWWDPGHIIAGYTGLKVHADGAHCGLGECIPYNHNVRIQDMGRIFSTSSEDDAIYLLQKYKNFGTTQCNQVKQVFGDIVPKNACDPVNDIYVIASNDLVGKYHWMSFFGDCLRQFGVKNADSCYSLGPEWFQTNAQAKDFYQLPISGVDQSQGVISYANGMVNLIRKGDQWVPVYNNKFVIREIDYFENGQEKHLSFQNVTDSIDGLLWVDPSMQAVIFMEPDVRNSLFTSMYFWDGAGLKHFQLVFNNPELKIFKVVF